MKKKPTNTSDELVAQVRPVLHVQLAGAVLEEVAARVVAGDIKVTLETVLRAAEQRAEQAAWRKAVYRAVNGPELPQMPSRRAKPKRNSVRG